MGNSYPRDFEGIIRHALCLSECRNGVNVAILLQGMKIFLNPIKGSADYDSHVKILRSLTSDNPGQQKRFDNVETFARKLFNYLSESIALRKDKGFEAAQVIIKSGKAKQLWIIIRKSSHHVEKEEEQLLEKER